jgi:hypothetical protein
MMRSAFVRNAFLTLGNLVQLALEALAKDSLDDFAIRSIHDVARQPSLPCSGVSIHD